MLLLVLSETLKTKDKDFSSQLTSGKIGTSHPAHFICYVLQLLCLMSFIFLEL